MTEIKKKVTVVSRRSEISDYYLCYPECNGGAHAIAIIAP